MAASGDALYTDNTLGLEYVGESATSYQRIRFNSLKMILDSANSAEYIKKTDRYEEMVDECLNLYEGKITSEEDETLFNNLKSDIAKYEGLIDTAQTYVAENKLDEAEAIVMGEAAEVGNSIQSTFEELFCV